MVQKVGNGLDLQLQRIINLGDPSAPSDAATKQYIDNLIRGLDWKASARVATTANITLSGTQTIDGVALAAGDRVLVKNQTDATTNGVYVVAAGAWSRANDFDGANGDVTASAALTVEQGTSQQDTVWLLITDGSVTIGTSPLAFSQLGGGVTYTAGNGITISGVVVSAKAATAGGILVSAAGISVDRSIIPAKYAVNIPAGSTSCVVTHNLGSTDVIVQGWDLTGAKPKVALLEADATDANTLTFQFATAPTSGQWRAVVVG